MEKVYIVVTGTSNDESDTTRIESIAYRDRAEAERRAAAIRADYAAGEYGIVPEDIFNGWPKDNICNSPVAEFKGYGYEQYRAQEERCDSWDADEVVDCRVLELQVKDAMPKFELCNVTFGKIPPK